MSHRRQLSQLSQLSQHGIPTRAVIPRQFKTNLHSRHHRHLERRLPVSGLERDPGCHPERSEGSGEPAEEIQSSRSELAQDAQRRDDSPSLQMSTRPQDCLQFTSKNTILYPKQEGNLERVSIAAGIP